MDSEKRPSIHAPATSDCPNSLESGVSDREKISLGDGGSSLHSQDSLETGKDEPEPSKEAPRPRKAHRITVAVCGFLVNFLVSGLGNTYGLFQLYYQENAGSPTSILPENEALDREKIALIGALGGSSISYFGLVCITPLLCRAVPAVRRTWPCFSNVTWISVTGAILMATGLFCASFSHHLWHLIMSHGLLTGIGGALLWNPTTIIAPEYFPGGMGLAMGSISAGAGFGGLALPSMVQCLLDHCGLRGTLRVLGIVTGISGLVLAFASPPPRQCEKRDPLPGKKLWTSPLFWLIILAELTFSLAALLPNNFAPVISKSLGYSSKESATHLLILNIVGIPARIAWGAARDKVGSQNSIIFASVLLALSPLLWLCIGVSNGFWVAFLAIWGMGTSGFGTIVNAYVLDIFGVEPYFGAVGVVNVARGIGSLAGPPLAGVIAGKGADTNFANLMVLSGALLVVTAAASVSARILHARKVGWKWMA